MCISNVPTHPAVRCCLPMCLQRSDPTNHRLYTSQGWSGWLTYAHDGSIRHKRTPPLQGRRCDTWTEPERDIRDSQTRHPEQS